MSNDDSSDNNSVIDSSDEGSDDESIIHVSNKKPLLKPSLHIKTPVYNLGDDEESIDDAEGDDAEEDDLEDEEDEQNGGADDDDEPVEIPDDADTEEDDDNSDIEIDEDGEPIEKVLSQKSKISTKSKKPQLIIQDDEDEDEDEYDENYLQKFDNEIIKNYISEFHPECLNNNYDEIQKLSIVTRGPDGIIIDPLHRTIPYLTKYEKARILGQRAKQIETGVKPLVSVPDNIVDSYIIAELELREKRIPFIIRRPIPGGGCEYWSLKDLEFIAF